jgi:phospholipid/cholesterol/gamma-HCH transport system permease protein
MNIVRSTGETTLNFLRLLGSFVLFLLDTFRSFRISRFYCVQLGRHLLDIGYYSLPVIGMTAIFTGAVLALQSYTGFSRFNAENSIASVVVLSITRELGPVLGGLMLAGRVSAAIAAEIATMRVSEQIDALDTMNTNPMSYLIAPRVIASIIVMPILVLIADIIGVLGGFLIGVYKLGFNPYSYLQKTMDYLEFDDVKTGLVKAVVFGVIVSAVGCYQGYTARGGARGVGEATTSAVVMASILILLANYVVTSLMFTS